jgi:hypothetical protein
MKTASSLNQLNLHQNNIALYLKKKSVINQNQFVLHNTFHQLALHNTFHQLALANNVRLRLIIIILDNKDVIIIIQQTLDAENLNMQQVYMKDQLKTTHGQQDATTEQEIET